MDRRERIGDPLESLRQALEGRQAMIWTALPGIITAYSPQAMTVSVQPAIAGSVEEGPGQRRSAAVPVLVDVPVCFPCGGGYSLTFPIQPGDECIVVFAARCLDGWWQSGGVQPQAERRMHDLSDGMAIVGLRSQPRVLAPLPDTSAVQLRADDGSQFVSIDPAGTVAVQATTAMTLTAPQIHIAGDIALTGTLTTTQDVIASQDVIAQGISLRSHVHGGVIPGGGTTGGPQ